MRERSCIVTFQDIEEQPILGLPGTGATLRAFSNRLADDAGMLYISAKSVGQKWLLSASGAAWFRKPPLFE